MTTQSDFLSGLDAELHLRGLSFTRANVLAFAEGVWQLAQEDPDPVRWADAFVEAGYARHVKRTMAGSGARRHAPECVDRATHPGRP
jgi:hypothetical protein